MKPLLELNNLSITFDTGIQRIKALDNVSLHVNNGEIVGVIGESGSGKSTLAKTIVGLQAKNQSSSGNILFQQGQESSDILKQSAVFLRGFRQRKATIVFQNPLLNLNPSVSIRSHFERVLAIRGKKDGAEIIAQALTHVDLATDMSQILSSFPHQLSGGQQQRVLIAIAICQEVDILLLDEPLSSLDRKNQLGISKILRQLIHERNMSIVLISHDLNIIGELADRVYVLHKGKIVEHGRSATLLANPKDDYTKELVNAQVMVTMDRPNDCMTPLIIIENLSHVYRKGGFLSINKSVIEALVNINITITKGTITGLVGPSGSGKSTLVQLLIGNETLQKGSIRWKGVDHMRNSMWKRIQIVPQNTANALNPRMLLSDQLKEVYQKCYPNSNNFKQAISVLLEEVGMDKPFLQRYPSELSGGEIQRMAILRALIARPEVLILDESLSALDMVMQAKIVKLIKELNQNLKMTIIIISHDDRLIQACCDDVLRLEQGRSMSM